MERKGIPWYVNYIHKIGSSTAIGAGCGWALFAVPFASFGNPHKGAASFPKIIRGAFLCSGPVAELPESRRDRRANERICE